MHTINPFHKQTAPSTKPSFGATNLQRISWPSSHQISTQ